MGSSTNQDGKAPEMVHCSVTEETGGYCSDIRTKVFRIGAPLLRTTIPVSLGRSGCGGGYAEAAVPKAPQQEHDDCSDVETVISLEDADELAADLNSLSVTLDFPC